MTTYQEEFERAKKTRTNAMLSFRSVRTLKAEAEQRMADLTPIVFGDGTNKGIIQIVALYMEQSRLSGGRKTSTPDFSSNYVQQLKNDMALSVTPSGDGTDGLYPPEVIDGHETERAQREFNMDSKWVNSFSLDAIDSPTGVGVRQYGEYLATAIGVVASDNSDGRGPFLTYWDAVDRRDADCGSGYLGQRTCNNEIYTQPLEGFGPTTIITEPPYPRPEPVVEEPEDDDNNPFNNDDDVPSGGSSHSVEEVEYFVGMDGIDAPDDYSFKSDLLDRIDALKTALATYRQKLVDTIYEIGHPGPILTEFHIAIPSDTTRMNNVISQIDTDTGTLNTYRSWFNNITPSGNRSAINNKLAEFRNFLNDTFIPRYRSYSDASSSQLGTKNGGTRQGLIYWVRELVKKPDEPYPLLEGIGILWNDAWQKLKDADNWVNVFSTDHNSWLATPSIISIFNQAILKLDRSVKRWETHILWDNILAANKYKLLRKVVTTLENLDNTAWSLTGAEDIIDLSPSGFLVTTKIITPPTQDTIFRIMACDETGNPNMARVDEFNTYSLQSDIISTAISFTQLEKVEDQTCLHITNTPTQLIASDYLVLNGNTLAQIKVVSDSDIRLDGDYGTVTSVKKLFGYYKVTEL